MEKAENKIITFKDRVLIEINQSQKEFIGNELTMEKLSKEEIDELTGRLAGLGQPERPV